MRNAEMLVWAGDFNYRIEATYEDALDHIRCNDLEYLLERVCTPQHVLHPACVIVTICCA